MHKASTASHQLLAASNHSSIVIVVEGVTLASNVLEAGLMTMENVILDAEAINVSLLFQKSEFHKQAMAKSNKTIININQGTSCRKTPLVKAPAFMTPAKRAKVKNVGIIKHQGK